MGQGILLWHPGTCGRPWDRLLQQGAAVEDGDRELQALARWVDMHGPNLGFRRPNVRERSRVLGMGAYLDGLRLSERSLFDAQGNAFDRAILGVRIGRALAAWVSGGSVPSHSFPTPDQVRRIYNQLASEVAAAGHEPHPHPIPTEVQQWLERLPPAPPAPLPLTALGGRGL